jgi:hypothetical protein
VVNTISASRARNARIASFCSERLTALLSVAASTPRSPSLSAWSFMSEMSGEATTVVPFSCSAGSW